MFDYESFNEHIKRKFPEEMSHWWVERLVENLTQWMSETYAEGSPETVAWGLLSLVPDLEADEILPFAEEYKENKGKVRISLDRKAQEIVISLTKNGETVEYRYSTELSETLKEMINWRHFYEDKGYQVQYDFLNERG